MEYVSNGMVNEHAIRFPYQVAENVTHLRFTWGGARRNVRYLGYGMGTGAKYEGVGTRKLKVNFCLLQVRYSLKAVSDHFDVLPILHLPAQGFVPRKSQGRRVAG